jgi:hypothetical protein
MFSGGAAGGASSAPRPGGGPAGFGDIFSGGMPQLRKMGAKPVAKTATLKRAESIPKSAIEKPEQLMPPPPMKDAPRRGTDAADHARKEREERERRDREDNARREVCLRSRAMLSYVCLCACVRVA